MQFSVEDIKKILGWNVASSFKEMEELLSFLDKYSDLNIHAPNDYNYVVVGTNIYAEMITDEFNAFPFEPEEYYELIKEFQRVSERVYGKRRAKAGGVGRRKAGINLLR